MAHQKGRQIYLQSEQIEALARLVDDAIVGCSDDLHIIEGYAEYAEGESQDYWGKEKSDKLAEQSLFMNLSKKLWYYGDTDG